MGAVIEVYCCEEPSHEGREAHVATLERMFADSSDEFWMATHRGSDRETVRPLDKRTRDGRALADAEEYDELLGAAPARPAALTLVLACDHPRCGLNVQRREPAARPVLNGLADAGESRIRLRFLAALLQ